MSTTIMDGGRVLLASQPGRTDVTPPAALLEVAKPEPKSHGLSVDEIRTMASQKRPPEETLSNIVQLIRKHVEVEVCSVYLLEPDRATLVLGATVGLRPESVGRVRMRLEEGLAGLAAEQLVLPLADRLPGGKRRDGDLQPQ